MTHFLVTGASGLLGLNFCLKVAKDTSHNVTGVVFNNNLKSVPFPTLNADLSASSEVLRVLNQAQPDVIIHCAALANLDACEKYPEQANRMNTELPHQLAEYSQKEGIQLVHISTDAVFDGVDGDYDEDDPPNPRGVYARTKQLAERAVAAANQDALIARVNFYGCSISGQRSLSEFFYHNLTSGKKVMGFTDVLFCPLLVNDLVDILLEMTELQLKGIYHTVSAECLSKYQFGLMLANQFGLNGDLIEAVQVADSGLVAPRSPNLSLNTEKLANHLSKPLPLQLEGVQKLQKLYQNGYPQMIRSLAAD